MENNHKILNQEGEQNMQVKQEKENDFVKRVSEYGMCSITFTKKDGKVYAEKSSGEDATTKLLHVMIDYYVLYNNSYQPDELIHVIDTEVKNDGGIIIYKESVNADQVTMFFKEEWDGENRLEKYFEKVHNKPDVIQDVLNDFSGMYAGMYFRSNRVIEDMIDNYVENHRDGIILITITGNKSRTGYDLVTSSNKHDIASVMLKSAKNGSEVSPEIAFESIRPTLNDCIIFGLELLGPHDDISSYKFYIISSEKGYDIVNRMSMISTLLNFLHDIFEANSAIPAEGETSTIFKSFEQLESDIDKFENSVRETGNCNAVKLVLKDDDIVDMVFRSSEEIDTPRDMNGIFLQAVSEMGELAQEVRVLTDSGYYRTSGEDGVLGEACDVMIALLDMLYKAGYNRMDVNETVAKKLDKWRNKVKARETAHIEVKRDPKEPKWIYVLNKKNGSKIHVLQLVEKSFMVARLTDDNSIDDSNVVGFDQLGEEIAEMVGLEESHIAFVLDRIDELID